MNIDLAIKSAFAAAGLYIVSEAWAYVDGVLSAVSMGLAG